MGYISLVRKTKPLAGKRFAWPGNGTLGQETVPLIWETWEMRDFANSELVADSRFHVTGKRNRLPGSDFAYLGNVADALFR